MVDTYDLEYLGYRIEAAFGTSLITAVGSTAYKYGVMSGGSRLPWAERILKMPPIPVNQRHPSGAPTPAYYQPIGGPTNTLLVDGVPLYLSFGETANVGVGAPYTHTLSFPTGAAAAPADPVSCTWHRERVDRSAGLGDRRDQLQGCRVTQTRIECSSPGYEKARHGFLWVQQNWAGLTQTKPAFSLTTKPAHPATGNPTIFNWTMLTTDTLGGEDMRARGVVKWALHWAQTIIPMADFRHDAGTDKSYIPNRHSIGAIAGVFFELWAKPNLYRGMDDVIGVTGTDDLSIVFTRAANDTITFTGTNMWAMKPREDMMAKPTDEGLVHQTYYLESLGCVVVDALAGATYYP